MITEVSESEFDTIEYRNWEEVGNLGGREIRLCLQTTDIPFVIERQKAEHPILVREEIKPMMSGGARIEISVGFEDTRGNQYEVKVAYEKDKESNNDNQTSSADRADPPDSHDKDNDSNG